MITSEQYFQAKPHEPEHSAAAFTLLEKVNELIEWARLGGFAGDVDPDTGTQISGSKGGAGDGGFRLTSAKTGAVGSKHKSAHAVDVYDPDDVLDRILSDDDLARFGLYREAPDSTPGWAHLQDVASGSGKRTFHP